MNSRISPPHPSSVLLVSEPLTAGPSAIYARHLMSGLSAASVYHPLLTPSPPGLELLTKEEMRFVQPAQGLYWLNWRPFVYRSILTWVREQEPELIHGISEHTAHLAANLSESLKLPYLLTVHQYLERNTLHITSRCQALIAVSEPLREHLVNDAELPKERVRVIAPGVGPAAKRHSERSKAPTGDALYASADFSGTEDVPQAERARLVVSIGDFNRTSDYATFMEATRSIVDAQNEACSIVVCGEGPQESSLRKFCRELKLDQRVTFCHGHTEIERLLGEADVYVQTTRREGFAIRALQAMSLGVPVVAVSNGAVLELIDDGVTGYIVPPANHALLAERILALLNDAALREKIGGAAKAAAGEHYSVRKMMDATLATYREITG